MTNEQKNYLYTPAIGLSAKSQYRLELVAAQDDQEELFLLNHLVYNGNAVAIFNPEHPDGTTDEAAIQLGRKLLASGKYGTDGVTCRDVLVVKELPSMEMLSSVTETVETEVEDMTYKNLPANGAGITAVVSLELMETIPLESHDHPLLYGFVFRVEIS